MKEEGSVSAGSWARSAPAWARTLAAVTAGVGTGAATAAAAAAWAAPAVGWISAAAFYLAWTWAVVLSMNSRETAAHATREDPSRPVFDLLLLAASIASLGAIALLLVQGRSADPSVRNLTAALALCSVAAAWSVTHTVYMLRYARLYYTGPDGGIDFNQEECSPRYRDFAYLAFTIGMTYQVSDTNLRTPQIRATVLRHALLSFLLGAVVLATTVNLVASLGR